MLLEKCKDRNLALIRFDFKDPLKASINDFPAVVHASVGQAPICSGVYWFNVGPDDWLKKRHPLTKPAPSAPEGSMRH